MRTRNLVPILASTMCIASACGPNSPESGSDNTLAEVQVAITVVPTGVQCLRATVTIGVTTTTAPLVTLTPGASSTSISLGQLAAGAATFNAGAFNVSCASVTTSTVPTWISDPATAVLAPGVLTTVSLTFRRNNVVSVSSNFADNIAQVSAGMFGTYAVMADGTVKEWGISGGAFSLTPIAVPSLTNVVQVSGGNSFACARKKDATVWCWGFNQSGVLGPSVPLNTFQSAPVQISTAAIDLTAGNAHVCAVTNANLPVCWGENDSGQLGNGTTTDSATPVLVQLPGGNASRVFAGGAHSCALRGDGSAWCWGSNTNGQLGDGTTATRLTPVSVFGLALQVEMALGNQHTCGLRGDGLLRCWGANGTGQLGDGTQVQRLGPVAVSGVTDGVQVVAGQNFSCVRRNAGAIACWGIGESMGDGIGDARLTPGTVPNLTGATQLRAHMGQHACAEMSDRTVKCWGNNENGQIGDGTITVAAKPTNVLLQ